MLKKEFRKFRNFVFDLDGTVWYWDELIPGVKETIEHLQKEGREIYFVTNNSMLSPEGFLKKLKGFGLKTDIFHITSSPEMVLEYLKKKGAKKIFCMSLKETRDYFKRNGLEISEEPDCVVVNYNEEGEEKIKKAAEFVSKGIPFITNATGKLWVLSGKKLPGTGVFVEKVEKLSGMKVEVVGKPSDFSVSYVRNKYSLNPEETVMFGDSLNSDIKFARKLGWAFAFVLTGEYTGEDLEKIEEKPDFVLESVKDALE